MSEIIYPSTSLLHCDVHKLNTTACKRKYWFRYILNLVPRGFNINFWYGSVLGEGVEVLLKTKDIKKALSAMRKKDKELLANEILLPEQREEIALQRSMLFIIVKVWAEAHKKYIDSVVLVKSEERFKIKLEQSPVYFEGTLDGQGHVVKSKKQIMFEIKSASSQYLNNDYFKHLLFDKQINGYAAGKKKSELIKFGECHYLVFRKPAIRVRQNEEVEEFLERLEDDLHDRADWYYIEYKHPFGIHAVEAAYQDIESLTFDLYCKYEFLKGEKILNPFKWGREDGQCFRYGKCRYFNLCKSVEKYPLKLKGFKSRELRYDLEPYELDKTHPITRPCLKMKPNKVRKTKRVKKSKK